MTRRRVLTDEQCRELAEWAAQRGSMTDKARELGISVGTLRDAILRGQGKEVGHVRRKVSEWLATLTNAPRETVQESQITSLTTEDAQ